MRINKRRTAGSCGAKNIWMANRSPAWASAKRCKSSSSVPISAIDGCPFRPPDGDFPVLGTNSKTTSFRYPVSNLSKPCPLYVGRFRQNGSQIFGTLERFFQILGVDEQLVNARRGEFRQEIEPVRTR